VLKLSVTGLKEAVSRLDGLQSQLPYAAAQAMNTAGFDTRRALQQKARAVFDRPTPFITDRSLRVWERATKDSLATTVGWDYIGGKGGDPAQTLQAQVSGGARPLKRFERALQRAGIMPRGTYAVPGGAAPLDAFGNIESRFIVQLLSYLSAFSEVGYKANITAKGKAKLARRARSEGGFVRIDGVEYFVSRGAGQTRRGQQQHLPAGIWSRKGIHGSDIQPVLMFVRRPSYSARLPAQRIAVDTFMASFNRAFPEALAKASRSARGR
jgi:hypothetical protein